MTFNYHYLRGDVFVRIARGLDVLIICISCVCVYVCVCAYVRALPGFSLPT